MKHAISVNANNFVMALKDAALYIGKDNSYPRVDYVLVKHLPEEGKMAVIGCDLKGYYEAKLPLTRLEGEPEPSLPQGHLCIDGADAARIVKLMPKGAFGWITLTVDDEDVVEGRYRVTVTFADGTATVVLALADIEVPNYGIFLDRVAEGRKGRPDLFQQTIPMKEMLRAGKVFSKKGCDGLVMWTAENNGVRFALLEPHVISVDMAIRVIFVLVPNEENTYVAVDEEAKDAA